MQTALLQQPLPSLSGSGDPLRASVGHLLARAYTLPCSTAAQAFSQLVQPTSRFQLALDALLPLLDTPTELAQRILVAFILYSLYAPHPIAINPFRSALHVTFIKERDRAVSIGNSGGVSESEQLVWVLWKILRGDGNDLGPYSPSTLARSPLPPKLRASNLVLDESSSGAASSGCDTYDNTQNSKNNDWNNNDPSSAHALDQSVDNRRQSTPITVEEARAEDDKQNDSIALAMQLLLAARERVLTLSEQRILAPVISNLTSPPMITSYDLASLISNNPSLAQPLLVALLTSSSTKSNSRGLSAYLDVLAHLTPTLPSFDLLGRLLRDPTAITDFITGGRTTIADLMRTEVLGRFIHESINWLENSEREEREGLISDDRFPKGVQNLCRFYSSLIKLCIVDPASDADSAEMAHFSLKNSRFEEANALYRTLVMGKY